MAAWIKSLPPIQPGRVYLDDRSLIDNRSHCLSQALDFTRRFDSAFGMTVNASTSWRFYTWDIEEPMLRTWGQLPLKVTFQYQSRCTDRDRS